MHVVHHDPQTILINFIRRVDSASYQDVWCAEASAQDKQSWTLQIPAECLLLDSVRSISSLVCVFRGDWLAASGCASRIVQSSVVSSALTSILMSYLAWRAVLRRVVRSTINCTDSSTKSEMRRTVRTMGGTRLLSGRTTHSSSQLSTSCKVTVKNLMRVI